MGPVLLAARQAHVAGQTQAQAGGPVVVGGDNGGVMAAGEGEEEDAVADDGQPPLARWAAEEAAAEAGEKAAAEASGSFHEEDTGIFSEARWGKYLEKRRPRRRQLRWGRHLLTTGADCLVAAFKQQDPCQAVLGLLPYLREGAPFAVFCEYLEVGGWVGGCLMIREGGKNRGAHPTVRIHTYSARAQPMVELQGRLLQMGMLRLQLLSTWWREFQILPGRSHPSMNMSADGGFILTGIKVTRAPEEEGGFGEEEEEEDGEEEGREEMEGDGEEDGGGGGGGRGRRRGGRGGRGGRGWAKRGRR